MGAIDRPGLHRSAPLGSVCHRTAPPTGAPELEPGWDTRTIATRSTGPHGGLSTGTPAREEALIGC